MRIRMLGIVCILLTVACASAGQSNKDDVWVGVWRGQLDNLPGVELVITDEGGQLHGAILFYFHFRPDVNSPYTSTPGSPEPMFDLKVNGPMLTFEVSHRRAHPPRTMQDPPMTFNLKLTGPDKGELANETEGDGPRVALTRSDY